ncbi:MAG: MBL fold metallo-hydrolase, partial [Nitrososphaeraceae archaeon]
MYPQLSFSETVNTKNQSFIESIPFTFIGIENNKTVNPLLLEQSKVLSPARVIEVTSGVYTAIGYGPSNIIMVEGTDGMIMIDSGSSVDQAQRVLSEFRKITDKSISALIYTNGKADHVGGGGVFVNDSKTQEQLPDIIA